jgi:hypothetical protein
MMISAGLLLDVMTGWMYTRVDRNGRQRGCVRRRRGCNSLTATRGGCVREQQQAGGGECRVHRPEKKRTLFSFYGLVRGTGRRDRDLERAEVTELTA